MTETAVIERESNLPAPVVTLEAWARRRAEFNRFVNEQLREQIDYGRIPGVDRPTLLKPGAEKILQLYGCAVALEVTRREQDAATGHLSIEVAVKAVSIASRQAVGMGVGSCSTYESKYRYRWEWWNAKGAPTGGEWEQTRGGKWRRHVENRDLADQWNTVLKMAKKRAMVDLALTISGASERFTQDVEDAAPEPAETPAAATPDTKTAPASEPEQHWSDRLHNGATMGAFWIAKAAEKRSLTTAYVADALGDLHGYADYDAARIALDAKVAEASK